MLRLSAETAQSGIDSFPYLQSAEIKRRRSKQEESSNKKTKNKLNIKRSSFASRIISLKRRLTVDSR
jgi:hypothetical protein